MNEIEFKTQDDPPEHHQEVLAWDTEKGYSVCIARRVPDDPSYSTFARGKTFLDIKSSGCGCCDSSMLNQYIWLPLSNPEKI